MSTKKSETKKNWFWLALSLILFLVITIISATLVLIFNRDSISLGQPIKALALERFDSCQDISNKLNQYLQDRKEYLDDDLFSPQPFLFRNNVLEDSIDGQTMPPGLQNTIAGSEYSQTNNQVAEVDEGDIAETDGRYIYSLNNNYLNITKIKNGIIKKISEVDLGQRSEKYLMHLLPESNQLVIIRDTYEWQKEEDQEKYNYYEDAQFIQVIILDISEPKLNELQSQTKISDIETLAEYSLEGNVSDTRVKNNTLFVISNINKYFYYDRVQEEEEITESDAKRFIPKIKDIKNNQTLNKDCSDIEYFSPIISYDTITSISGISLDNLNTKETLKSKTILGGGGNYGQNIYMSSDFFYLSQYKAYNFRIQNIQESDKTIIYKFAAVSNEFQFQAKGEVKGSILNQYSMDEYNGNLRIATTTDAENFCIFGRRCRNIERSNGIYVFDENLNLRGSIDGLAKSERVFSARFLGDRGYVMTFRQTDPLFTFDLSDRDNPKLTGELKIPGFSNYLHPIADGYLIGVGNQADEKTGFSEGVKLSLFDIRDDNNPKEVDFVELGLTGSSSIVNTDPKAFLWDVRNNLVSIPVNLQTDQIDFGKQFNGTYTYKVNFDSGFELLGRVSHTDLEEAKRIPNKNFPEPLPIPAPEDKKLNQNGEVIQNQNSSSIELKNPDTESNDISMPIPIDPEFYPIFSNLEIKRQVFIDNYLVTISDKAQKSNNLNNFQEISNLVFANNKLSL